jgi:hypothetical protein
MRCMSWRALVQCVRVLTPQSERSSTRHRMPYGYILRNEGGENCDGRRGVAATCGRPWGAVPEVVPVLFPGRG